MTRGNVGGADSPSHQITRSVPERVTGAQQAQAAAVAVTCSQDLHILPGGPGSRGSGPEESVNAQVATL